MGVASTSMTVPWTVPPRAIGAISTWAIGIVAAATGWPRATVSYTHLTLPTILLV